MTRTQCTYETNLERCKKKFRSRITHKYCRMHHRQVNDEARPISSRELVTHGYRRTRNRRSSIIKSTPKVIQNKNKRDKNANG